MLHRNNVPSGLFLLTNDIMTNLLPLPFTPLFPWKQSKQCFAYQKISHSERTFTPPIVLI